MVAVPKPKIDNVFWNEYFMLEMADTFIVNIRGRTDLNVGPSTQAIGLKMIPDERVKTK